MANRIGITEAPLATLGETGVEQSLPVAETQDKGIITPKRTTIADLQAYIGGGGGGISTQIQRFNISDLPPTEIDPVDGQQINEVGPFVKINLTELNKTIFAGDSDFYSITDGEIGISVEGVYKMNWNIGGQYSNTSGTGAWRYRPLVGIGLATLSEAIEGDYIRPQSIIGTRNIGFARDEVIFEGKVNQSYGIFLALVNTGTSPSPNPATESMILRSQNGLISSYATIERLA